MAMYYQSSSEIQGDGLQTVYLTNPNDIGYSDTQPRFNMLFSNPTLVPHAPPPPQYISAHHYSMGGSGNNLQTPRGLSLSLAAHYQQTGCDHDFRAGQSMISPNNSSSLPNGGANTMQSAIMGSKYLKAAQELLDEVVSVGSHRTDKAKPIKDPTAAANKEAPSANKGGTYLTTTQKQEIQMKKAKLHSMLDEVEQRCRQYNHQMQMTVAAFEQAAGTGSTRSYTQVALKTILKQFRCLKSTISAQIKGLNKSLGEEEGSELSRLRFVDRQQVGMVHNKSWRPQRGLPERAVSLLRAWLFQHFLHPYPKDSDKQMLAKQTGLTKSQVSNWFINARVRLWKPMVEEMYLAIKPEPTPEVSPPPSLPANTNVAQLISSLKKPRSSFVTLSASDQRFSTESCLPMAAAENITRYGTCSGRGTVSLSL